MAFHVMIDDKDKERAKAKTSYLTMGGSEGQADPEDGQAGMDNGMHALGYDLSDGLYMAHKNSLDNQKKMVEKKAERLEGEGWMNYEV